MTEKSTPQAEVASAAEALARDAQAQPAGNAPVRRAPTRFLAIACIGLLAAIALNLSALRGPRPDPIVERENIERALAAVASQVRAQVDSLGQLPPSLGLIGVADLGISYTPAGDAFTLVALTSAGDSVVRRETITGAAR